MSDEKSSRRLRSDETPRDDGKPREERWFKQFCRALAAHAVMLAHPHLLQGGLAEDEHLNDRMERVADLIHDHATRSDDQAKDQDESKDQDGTKRPRLAADEEGVG